MIEVTELIDEQPVKQFLVDMEALPEVSSEDNGKLLGVVGGKWEAVDNDILPEVDSDDNGKILTVDSGEWVAGNHEKYVFNLDDNDRQNLHPVNFTFDHLMQTIRKGYNPIIYGLSGRVYYLEFCDPEGAFLNFMYSNTLLSSGVWSLRCEKITVRNDQSVSTSDIKSVTIS